MAHTSQHVSVVIYIRENVWQNTARERASERAREREREQERESERYKPRKKNLIILLCVNTHLANRQCYCSECRFFGVVFLVTVSHFVCHLFFQVFLSLVIFGASSSILFFLHSMSLSVCVSDFTSRNCNYNSKNSTQFFFLSVYVMFRSDVALI